VKRPICVVPPYLDARMVANEVSRAAMAVDKANNLSERRAQQKTRLSINRRSNGRQTLRWGTPLAVAAGASRVPA
jgi:hypothetical protein